MVYNAIIPHLLRGQVALGSAPGSHTRSPNALSSDVNLRVLAADLARRSAAAAVALALDGADLLAPSSTQVLAEDGTAGGLAASQKPAAGARAKPDEQSALLAALEEGRRAPSAAGQGAVLAEAHPNPKSEVPVAGPPVGAVPRATHSRAAAEDDERAAGQGAARAGKLTARTDASMAGTGASSAARACAGRAEAAQSSAPSREAVVAGAASHGPVGGAKGLATRKPAGAEAVDSSALSKRAEMGATSVEAAGAEAQHSNGLAGVAAEAEAPAGAVPGPAGDKPRSSAAAANGVGHSRGPSGSEGGEESARRGGGGGRGLVSRYVAMFEAHRPLLSMPAWDRPSPQAGGMRGSATDLMLRFLNRTRTRSGRLVRADVTPDAGAAGAVCGQGYGPSYWLASAEHSAEGGRSRGGSEDGLSGSEDHGNDEGGEPGGAGSRASSEYDSDGSGSRGRDRSGSGASSPTRSARCRARAAGEGAAGEAQGLSQGSGHCSGQGLSRSPSRLGQRGAAAAGQGQGLASPGTASPVGLALGSGRTAASETLDLAGVRSNLSRGKGGALSPAVLSPSVCSPVGAQARPSCFARLRLPVLLPCWCTCPVCLICQNPIWVPDCNHGILRM